jgi:hypothetical protein
MSDAKLLGVFQVSVLHNIVHLLFDVAGLALARTPAGSATYLIGGGIIYLVLWIYGLLVVGGLAGLYGGFFYDVQGEGLRRS